MGGLVARRFIALNAAAGNDYIELFVSLATPWGGVPSARLGAELMPVLVPSWADLVPEGRFIRSLQEDPIPHTVKHYLFFAYKDGPGFRMASSDGVVSLASQLDQWAQVQAAGVMGFNEDHAGVLTSGAAFRAYACVLEMAAPGDGRGRMPRPVFSIASRESASLWGRSVPCARVRQAPGVTYAGRVRWVQAVDRDRAHRDHAREIRARGRLNVLPRHEGDERVGGVEKSLQRGARALPVGRLERVRRLLAERARGDNDERERRRHAAQPSRDGPARPADCCDPPENPHCPAARTHYVGMVSTGCWVPPVSVWVNRNRIEENVRSERQSSWEIQNHSSS